jgi:hypothetical protein
MGERAALALFPLRHAAVASTVWIARSQARAAVEAVATSRSGAWWAYRVAVDNCAWPSTLPISKSRIPLRTNFLP